MSSAHPCLIDSKILVYMHDDHAADLQQQAIQVFEHLVRQRRAALSTQCLTEFFNGVTRRIQEPLPVSEAVARVDRIADATVVYPLTLDVVKDAVEAVSQHQMSLWDALIWAVAFRNGIPTILTQDKQSRSIIEGVRYVNPFDPGFDIASL